MVNTSYGAKMPINQVASINAPEPRLITVQVWDKSNLHGVEKAIREVRSWPEPCNRRADPSFADP